MVQTNIQKKLVPKLILQVMKDEKLPIHADGQNARSYCHYEDIIEVFDITLHKEVIGQVYNIDTRKERSPLDMAMDICKLSKLNPKEVVEFV